MFDIGKAFDKRFNATRCDVVHQKKFGGAIERRVGHENGDNRWFIGVLKWFDERNGPDGLGYVVTSDLGFEKWDKRGSDFVELPFTKKCCKNGIVPRERGVLIFRIGVAEGRRCVIELRSAQFIEDDFKLALTYTAKRYPIISGTSNKSNWRCQVHILSALLECAVPTEENLIKVRDWINSYLSCLTETSRNLVIDAWRLDSWLSSRLASWVPGLASSITGYPKHVNAGEIEETKEEGFVGGNDISRGVTDCHMHSERSDVEMSLGSHPRGYARAHEKLTNRIYIANVGKRLRSLNNPSPSDCKRWVWELLQNAKDTVAEGKVDAYFKVRGNKVEFKHNGAPFTYVSLDALLYKYSDGKESNESTGRFGTGFLTTHCLSKVVDIRGDVFDDDTSSGRRGFSVTMYRNGQTDEELLDGLDRMRDSLRFDKEVSGWTSFTYNVSESSMSAITLGIQELKRNLCKVLLFCPQLGNVELDYNGEIFSVKRGEIVSAEEGRLYYFKVCEGMQESVRRFVVFSISENSEMLSNKYKVQRMVSLDAAIEIDENNALVDYDDASIYCVFPFVGIENQLTEPIILNSPDWEPHEERQRLLFMGKEYIDDSNVATENGVNRMIFCLAICLYEKLVAYVAQNGVGRSYLLAKGLGCINKAEDFDEEWYEKNIVVEYRKKLLEMTVRVDSRFGEELAPLRECYIVDESDTELTHKIMELMQRLGSFVDGKFPITDNDEWVSWLWRGNDIRRWNLESLSSFVESKRNWSELSFCDDVEKVNWFNSFISLVRDEDKSILSRKKLIPDMNGDLHAIDDKSFEQGEGVDDFVIDLLTQLGKDYRANLLNPGIRGVELSRKFNSVRYSSEIDKLVSEIVDGKLLNENQRLEKLSPLLRVVVVGDKCDDGFKHKRGMTDELLRRLFRISDLAPVECSALLESAWKTCDKWLGQIIPARVASCRGVDGIISAEISHDKGDVFDLLNSFYEWCKLLHIDVAGMSVFPNQFGTFMPLNELTKESDPIDEKIKDLIARLDEEKDPRINLLDTRCKVDGGKTISAQEVYALLDSMIAAGKDNSDIKGTDMFREVVRELLDDWKEEHGSDFDRYFPRASKEYNELELNVVHTKEERQLANDLLKKYPFEQLKALAAGVQGYIAVRRENPNDATPDTIAISIEDGQYAGLADAQKHDALVEAKKRVRVSLAAEGYEFTKGICEEEYSIVNGVMKNGVEYPLVVHSYIDRSRPFQLNAADWVQLMKPNSMLMVHTEEGVCPVPFKNLVCNRDKIDFSISTRNNLDLSDRIASLAHVLRWFRGLRFDFGSLIPMKAGTAQLFDFPENPIPEGGIQAGSVGDVE